MFKPEEARAHTSTALLLCTMQLTETVHANPSMFKPETVFSKLIVYACCAIALPNPSHEPIRVSVASACDFALRLQFVKREPPKPLPPPPPGTAAGCRSKLARWKVRHRLCIVFHCLHGYSYKTASCLAVLVQGHCISSICIVLPLPSWLRQLVVPQAQASEFCEAFGDPCYKVRPHGEAGTVWSGL